MRTILTAFLGLLVAAPTLGRAEPTAPETAGAPKAVLVTGASTGIGRMTAELLASHGYFVYAGARKQADLEALDAIDNVQAVRLDVTLQPEIDAAVETIAKAGRGLYGVVNNAGVATVGPTAETSTEEFDLVMEVNVHGPVRVTKAFLPLVLAEKGRIVNIGSIAGVLASPDLGVYSMSKHAIEAFTDSLAAQLAPLGVRVSVVEPGKYDSNLGQSAAARTGKESGFTDRGKYKKPEEVAAAVAQALFDANPKRRYLVVSEQQEAEITIRKQLKQLVELNEGQPYTYDREALIKMLDAALKGSRPRTP